MKPNPGARWDVHGRCLLISVLIGNDRISDSTAVAGMPKGKHDGSFAWGGEEH